MSTTDINAQLDEAENELYMIINAQKRLQIVENEIDIVGHNIRAQGVVMKEELADVERLEKNGVSALFQKVLGNHEEQLEKERQEYLQEVLTYNSYIDELEVLNYEKKILANKVSRKQEIEKLQVALNSTIAATHKVKYSSYEKKGYIDKAQALVGAVQVKFNIFEKELQDLYPDYDLNIDNYHFKAFVENFYDGLITDWIIVKKLQVALNSTIAATHKVERESFIKKSQLS